MKAIRALRTALVVGLASACFGTAARGELIDFYVALDTAPNEPIWSAYNDFDGDGIPNTVRSSPNAGRLSLLWAHAEPDPAANHFHTIGRYAYTGPLENPSVTDKNEYSFWAGSALIQGLPGHLIPEQFGELGGEDPPLALRPTDGLYAGKLTTIPGNSSGAHYANMEIRTTADLVPYAPGTPEHSMLHSLEPYGEKWDAPLTGAVVAIELVDITPGLHIGDLGFLDILTDPGDTAVIGVGEAFSYTPVFWVDADAALGVYTATMRLVDLRTDGDPFLPSGQYQFSFAPVPEPSTWALAVAGIGFLFAFRRRALRRR